MWTWTYEELGGAETDPYADGGWSSDEDLLTSSDENRYNPIPGTYFPYSFWIYRDEDDYRQYDPYDTD